MVQAPTKPITLEAFLQQPETKPASEYVDGHIIQKPVPELYHSGIQADLIKAIDAALSPNKIARAFPELRCTFENCSIIPDITVLPWHQISHTENGKLSGELLSPPPWMIEILSEGQNQTKVVKKILHSLEHGTQIGWLIDPSEDCVFGYTPDLKTKLYENPEQSLPVPDFAKDFQLTVGELVSWLYE
ncbi:MAG: Uma2 family endonuclease [Cyanobacteria bacterium J06614_10]